MTGADGRVPVVMALAATKSFDEHRPVKLAGGVGVKNKSLTLIAILTDVHLWVPVVVLILGTTLLMMLR